MAGTTLERDISNGADQPYRQIFSEIEAGEFSPLGAYSHFLDKADRLGLDPIFYLSMAITAGGFGRDTNLMTSQAVWQNACYAESLKRNLVKSLRGSNSGDFIVPSELGRVDGWGQADYLLFWSYVITGIDPKEASLIEENIGIAEIRQLPGFNDTSLPFELRFKSYKFLIDRYVELLRQFDLGKGESGTKLPQNIRAIILILDPQISLGVNAERYLSHLLGFGEYSVSIDSPSSKLSSFRSSLKELGADPVILESEWKIAGRVNEDVFWKMRSQGFRFRRSGILNSIWDKERKKELANMVSYVQKTPEELEELWKEYFTSD